MNTTPTHSEPASAASIDRPAIYGRPVDAHGKDLEYLALASGYRAFGGDHAELGYWIGKPYWVMGYATEAVRALILHAFETGGFAYIKVGHFSDNPASARIIAKFGFAPECQEMRDCAARGARAHCLTYRLDRATALAGFYKK